MENNENTNVNTDNPVFYINPEWEAAVAFLCVLVLFALILKVWLIWQALIIFIIIICVYCFVIYKYIKAIKLYQKNIIVIDLLKKIKKIEYTEILLVNIIDIKYKDSGKQFVLYLKNNNKIFFTVRNKNQYNNLIVFFNELDIKITHA